MLLFILEAKFVLVPLVVQLIKRYSTTPLFRKVCMLDDSYKRSVRVVNIQPVYIAQFLIAFKHQTNNSEIWNGFQFFFVIFRQLWDDIDKKRRRSGKKYVFMVFSAAICFNPTSLTP